MRKYLWAINVVLLRCLVIFGLACVCQAFFRYPGSRFQGHAAYESATQRYNAEARDLNVK